MKTEMFRPLLLLVGLALGLAGMWAVASPTGATGDLVTGGWYGCYNFAGKFYACTSSDSLACSACSGTFLQNCSNYGADCRNGYISVVSCVSNGSGTSLAGHTQPCTGVCSSIYTGSCY